MHSGPFTKTISICLRCILQCILMCLKRVYFGEEIEKGAWLFGGKQISTRALTPALLGLWIFHRLLGGGGAFERPPMISAPGRRREKRKAAFESSRKIISKSFRSFFGSGQNWGLQGSKFQNFPKRFFDNKIFNFKDRATNLIPSCLSR